MPEPIPAPTDDYLDRDHYKARAAAFRAEIERLEAENAGLAARVKELEAGVQELEGECSRLARLAGPGIDCVRDY